MGIANPLTSPAHKIGGLYFNGRNAYVKVPDSESLDITDAITIEAWVNLAKITYYPGVVAKQRDTAYWIGTNSKGVAGFQGVIGGNSVDWYPGPTLSLGKYYHLVFTYDGSYMRYYGNGVKTGEAAKTGKIGVSDLPLVIGASINGNGNIRFFWLGLIDEVRIYNRALSEEEIQLLYSNPDYPLTDGLVLWLPMNEHSGNTVYDLSPYGNHGTIHNAVWAVRAVEHPLHAV